MEFTRTWAQIDLDAIEHNMREIRRLVNKDCKVLAVVKADAYGHGVEKVAKAALGSGADRLAVACVSEAKQLRRAGFTQPILILGAVSNQDVSDIVKYDITASVFSYDTAKQINKACKILKKRAKIHIKVDTGMSRIGFVAGEDETEAINEIKKINQLDMIEIEGIFSHFATSDEASSEYMEKQFKVFLDFTKKLKDEGVDIPIRHIANSAAIMMYPHTHLEMVRAGIILYGLYPSQNVDKKVMDLVPAMSMKSRITMVKEKQAGWGVSYGREYITGQRTKIATIPVGYADGYTRNLQQKAYVMLKDGTRAKIIGRICMDQCMIDVTNVNNISTGDEVTLFGKSGVTADDIAQWMNTINYEVVCLVSKRIPRVYIQGGKIESVRNYIDELS